MNREKLWLVCVLRCRGKVASLCHYHSLSDNVLFSNYVYGGDLSFLTRLQALQIRSARVAATLLDLLQPNISFFSTTYIFQHSRSFLVLFFFFFFFFFSFLIF